MTLHEFMQDYINSQDKVRLWCLKEGNDNVRVALLEDNEPVTLSDMIEEAEQNLQYADVLNSKFLGVANIMCDNFIESANIVVDYYEPLKKIPKQTKETE